MLAWTRLCRLHYSVVTNNFRLFRVEAGARTYPTARNNSFPLANSSSRNTFDRMPEKHCLPCGQVDCVPSSHRFSLCRGCLWSQTDRQCADQKRQQTFSLVASVASSSDAGAACLPPGFNPSTPPTPKARAQQRTDAPGASYVCILSCSEVETSSQSNGRSIGRAVQLYILSSS